MSQAIQSINIALENTVLCRGTNTPTESYDYAARMSSMIKNLLKKELTDILNESDTKSKLNQFIQKLN